MLRRQDDLFALCGNEGTVVFYTIKAASDVTSTHPESLPVEDAQWNPAENYLLVAYRGGTIKLFEASKSVESFVFERETTGIRCLQWMYNMSGDFITTSEKVGAFRLWNASQKSSKGMVKVGVTGIRCFAGFRDDPNRYVAAFKDGSLGLFDLRKRKLVWNIEAGHSETIFDIRFKPNDPSILATGSYDGYIKIWSLPTMKLLSTLSQQVKTASGERDANAQIVYSIAWAPGEDTRLVSAHANGEVGVWDYAKGKLLMKMRPGTDGPIFRLDWNQLCGDFIACGSNETLA